MGFVVPEFGSTQQIAEAAERGREAREEEERRYEAALDEARRRARSRLDQMIEKIRSAGGEAKGEVGTAHPLEAIKDVLQRESGFDEIIVSTLPSGLSRWLKMDLPSRVARLTEVPVTTVEAES